MSRRIHDGHSHELLCRPDLNHNGEFDAGGYANGVEGEKLGGAVAIWVGDESQDTAGDDYCRIGNAENDYRFPNSLQPRNPHDCLCFGSCSGGGRCRRLEGQCLDGQGSTKRHLREKSALGSLSILFQICFLREKQSDLRTQLESMSERNKNK